MAKKLIYILNHYSEKSVQHFYHVIYLLEKIADHDVDIALIIEKCEHKPEINHERILVYAQKEKKKWKRARELYHIIESLIKEEYDKIYIRISCKAALIACQCAHKHGAQVYFWNSGASFEFYKKQALIKKIKWYFDSQILFCLTKETVDYFVTGPEYMVDYYANVANVKREKLRLLYNDINVERFSIADNNEKERLREELGLEKDKKYILLVHRFSEVRRTDYYIPDIMEFTKDRSDIVLLMIGNGPDEQLLREKIKKSGLNNIHMLGAKPNAIIQSYYKACDIFINPSYTEGFPRVVIEAMACGKPIVATAAGGTRDLFDGIQTEFIVDVENRVLFATKLETMIDDEKIQQQCCLENRQRVQKYSTENVAKMYVNTIWNEN